MAPPFDFKEFQENLSLKLRPLQRSFQFWVRAADIYTDYKVFQVGVVFEKDVQKQEAMWERQHELAAEKIYSMCSDLVWFFLKVAQIIGKPDLAPAAWVKRLVTLCDQALPTPANVVRGVLEVALGQSMEEVFEMFDLDALGSAWIAQKALVDCAWTKCNGCLLFMTSCRSTHLIFWLLGGEF